MDFFVVVVVNIYTGQLHSKWKLERRILKHFPFLFYNYEAFIKTRLSVIIRLLLFLFSWTIVCCFGGEGG